MNKFETSKKEKQKPLEKILHIVRSEQSKETMKTKFEANKRVGRKQTQIIRFFFSFFFSKLKQYLFTYL